MEPEIGGNLKTSGARVLLTDDLVSKASSPERTEKALYAEVELARGNCKGHRVVSPKVMINSPSLANS